MHTDVTLANRPDLTTERLALRRPGTQDIDAICAAMSDKDTARQLVRVPFPYSRDDAVFFLEHVVPNEWTWAITLAAEARMIGAVGLTPEEASETAELGYWLAKPYWRSGIATEAAERVIRFGFEDLELPYITSGYLMTNPASGRVLAKLGFRELGKVTRSHLAEGSEVEAMDLRLERGEWERRQSGS